MKLRSRILVCLLAVLGWLPPARADNPEEYRLKAAILFNFVAFTEWPAGMGSTLNLCVYGQDPFGEDLDRLQGRQASGRTLAVRRAGSVDGLGDCQVVFVARPAIGNLPRVLDRLSNRPVLTVADSPGAAREGVMLNMVTMQNKVTFEANVSAARAHGLSLSSRLLRLATEVFK
jgi:hypothetical protein